MLHRESDGLQLIVAHADHGIAPDSAAVAETVRDLAARLGLPFVTAGLGLGPDTSETEARAARYQWLDHARQLHGARWVFTAHHADDQAETVLLRVLGGSGPAGLAGIRPVDGFLVRPLLGFKRSELLAFALERGLHWWEDAANQDPRHLRSWLRHQVLPQLRERLPDLDQRLRDVGRQAAGDRAAWDAVLDRLPDLEWRAESGGASLAAPGLAALDDSLGAAVAMAWVRRAGGLIGPGHAARVVGLARHSPSGARIELPGRWVVERAFGRLLLLRSAVEPLHAINLPAESPGTLDWGRWHLEWRVEEAPAIQARDAMTAWFIPQQLLVRGWQAGDRIAPIGGTGRRLAVRLFQDARIPRVHRTAWPILDREGTPVWIPGVCRSTDLLPAAGAPAIRLDVTAG